MPQVSLKEKKIAMRMLRSHYKGSSKKFYSSVPKNGFKISVV